MSFFQSFSKIQKWIIVIASLILVVLFSLVSLRNVLLIRYVEKKVTQFNRVYAARLIVEDAHFKGFFGVYMGGVKLISNNNDTLIDSKYIYARVKVIPLITGHIKFDKVQLIGFNINITQTDSLNNFSFLFSNKEKKKKGTVDYASRIKKMVDQFLNYIPSSLEVTDFSLKFSWNMQSVLFKMEQFALLNNMFSTEIQVQENNKHNTWKAQGSLGSREEVALLRLYADTGKVTIPIVKELKGLRCLFDTLRLELNSNTWIDTKYNSQGLISLSGLVLEQKKIALTEVKIEKAACQFNFSIGKDFIEFDSTSTISMNNYNFNPYFLVKLTSPRKITFKMHEDFNAQTFFTSLPTGLFTNFNGIKTSGNLKLDVDFFVDMSEPDSLEFNAGLIGKDFKIVKYGETDFSKINDTFIHRVYEEGVEVASFMVGPKNPLFTPLNKISLPLKEAVKIAENGGVYYQSGFDIYSLKQSIIQNIKKGKFVRGGSTIEMQLVKNVFLTKNKTIARKAEELLIVWLIQSSNICPPDRMFEVYLNIAEWGPHIYGINQASKFYFNKLPATLSVPESIFLASILPRPKWYKYSFSKDGNLDKKNQAYFSRIASSLVKRGTILPADTLNLLWRVKLRAESKALMLKDTSYFDMNAIQQQDEEFFNQTKKNKRPPFNLFPQRDKNESRRNRRNQ